MFAEPDSAGGAVRSGGVRRPGAARAGRYLSVIEQSQIRRDVVGEVIEDVGVDGGD